MRSIRRLVAVTAALSGAAGAPLSASADQACELARHLMQVEIASSRVTATGRSETASGIVDQMLARIAAIPAGSGRLIEGKLNTYELAGFVESRRQMARIFREQGLAAAQRHINQPSYANLATGVRVLERLLNCADEPAPVTAQEASIGGVRALQRHQISPDARAGPMNRLETVFLDFAPPYLVIAALGLAVAIGVRAARAWPRRRSQIRHCCDLPTRVAIDGETFEARILDISLNGAKLRTDHHLPCGRRASMELAGYGWIGFQVVWRNERFAGIRLLRALAIEPAELPRLVSKGANLQKMW